MSIEIIKEDRHLSQTAAKVGAQASEFDFEVHELPEGYDGQVLLDMALIAPMRPREKTAGGVILTAKTQEVDEYSAQLGKILKVGEAFYELAPHKDFKVKPKVGDFVQFRPYAGIRHQINEAMYILIRQQDIFAIIDPKFKYKIYT